MNLTSIIQFLDEEQAVSPVIGVILMVAITVILAAVIGTFVLGMGERVGQDQPMAAIGFDYALAGGTDDAFSITHEGGDQLDSADLTVTIAGETVYRSGIVNPDGNVAVVQVENTWTDAYIGAGDVLTVQEDGTGTDVFGKDDVVRVVWANDTDRSAIIAEGTVQ